MTALVLASMLAWHGCGSICAAGLIANFEAEAGPLLNPCISVRTGAGLPNWVGPRRRAMHAALGDRWCEPEAQLAYIVAEIDRMGLRQVIFDATDADAVAAVVQRRYLCPVNKDTRRRAARAKQIELEIHDVGLRQADRPQ